MHLLLQGLSNCNCISMYNKFFTRYIAEVGVYRVYAYYDLLESYEDSD